MKVRIGIVAMEVAPRNYLLNKKRFLTYARILGDLGVDIALFPEYCLTGFTEWDFTPADLYDEVVETASITARKYGMHVILGVLERQGNCVYNTSIILNADGDIILKHRKFQEPMKFCRGSKLDGVETRFGRLATIICGDLYNDEVLKQLREVKPTLLFIPMDYAPEKVKLREEVEVMSERIKMIETRTFIANTYNHHGSFGGAWAFTGKGKLISFSPGKTVLVVDVNAGP